MRASASRAFAVLVDPETYPHWLIGAAEIRDVDDAWPAVGSTFKHVVGVGPFRIPDGTEVLEIDDGEMLRLKVRARPFIWAVATFRVLGDDERCVVTMQEEPAARTIGNFVRPIMDPTMHVRNHRSLRRLARVVESNAT
jgi:hypothetical protein